MFLINYLIIESSIYEKIKVAVIVISVIALIVGILAFVPFTRDMGMKIWYPTEFSEIVQNKSEMFEVEEELIYAVIRTESSFEPEAQSGVGAKGLMQMTDGTFEWVQELLGAEEILPADYLFEPEINIHHGTYFLSFLMDYYGNVDTALAAYNAGMGNVASWLEDPEYSKDGVTLYEIPFLETKNYVKKVNEAMTVYKNLYNL